MESVPQQNQPNQEEVKENPETFEKCIQKLKQQEIEFKLLTHEPVRTSEQAAQIRGVPLGSGAKAMLSKWINQSNKKQETVLLVMSADQKIIWKNIRKKGYKNPQFCSEQEVSSITNCLPGAVPPFGSIFNVQTILDPSLSKYEQINFNVGLRTHSLSIKYEDYIKAENPIIMEFTQLNQFQQASKANILLTLYLLIQEKQRNNQISLSINLLLQLYFIQTQTILSQLTIQTFPLQSSFTYTKQLLKLLSYNIVA